MSAQHDNTRPANRVRATWAAWGAAHGQPSAAVGEALTLGGTVARVDGNDAGKGKAAGQAGDDCLALVRRAAAPDVVAEAAALDALGERRQARELREDIFVHALALWLECAGAVATLDVVNGLAFLLRVSPQTVKRYLAAHASPFGEFRLDGDFVLLREVKR